MTLSITQLTASGGRTKESLLYMQLDNSWVYHICRELWHHHPTQPQAGRKLQRVCEEKEVQPKTRVPQKKAGVRQWTGSAGIQDCASKGGANRRPALKEGHLKKKLKCGLSCTNSNDAIRGTTNRERAHDPSPGYSSLSGAHPAHSHAVEVS